jgi:hypothetical protein
MFPNWKNYFSFILVFVVIISISSKQTDGLARKTHSPCSPAWPQTCNPVSASRNVPFLIDFICVFLLKRLVCLQLKQSQIVKDLLCHLCFPLWLSYGILDPHFSQCHLSLVNFLLQYDIFLSPFFFWDVILLLFNYLIISFW